MLAERDEKQARLKTQRSVPTKTKDTAIQCKIARKSAEVAVQTDPDPDQTDVMKELKEQVKILTKIVADLTTLKYKESPILPDFDEDILDVSPFETDTSILDIQHEQPQSAYSPVFETASISQDLPTPPTRTTNKHGITPVSLQQSFQRRSPLATLLDPNVKTGNHGPTDEQRRKVEGLTSMGSQLITTAMACVDILFSEDELANSNTSGSNGYGKLDDFKLRFLKATLCNKFDSPLFSEEWDRIRVRINSKCRGKRRTVLRRLTKQF